MTEQEVIQLLRQRMGNQSHGAFPRSLGVSGGNMSNMLRGLQRPSKRLLRALGLVAVVSYRPIAEGEAEVPKVAAKQTKRKPLFKYGDWPVQVGR